MIYKLFECPQMHSATIVFCTPN